MRAESIREMGKGYVRVSVRGARSISDGFARCVRGVRAIAFVITTLLFAAVCGWVLRDAGQEQAGDRARLIAMAIHTAPTGSLGARIRRLLAECDDLLAVAVLDVHGTPYLYYPDSSSVRSLVMAGTDARARPVAGSVLVGDAKTPAWSITVPLSGVSSRSAQKVALVLRRDDVLRRWATATAVFGIGFLVVLGLIGRRQRRWFAECVAAPLSTFTRPWRDDLPTADWFDGLWTGGLLELDVVSDHLCGLFDAVSETGARAARTERITRIKIRDIELGAGRKVKHAMDQATTDMLTGLRNRRYLNGELPRLIETLRAEQSDLALVMFDLDNFKPLNDTRGHRAGDEMLQFVGELLRSVLRQEDIAVRLGGDEFLLVLPRTGARGAARLADRVVRLLAQHAAHLGRMHPVTLSAGVASLRQFPSASAKTLIARADDGLYRAKYSGKNRVVTCST